jgi:hypothetical protein
VVGAATVLHRRGGRAVVAVSVGVAVGVPIQACRPRCRPLPLLARATVLDVASASGRKDQRAIRRSVPIIATLGRTSTPRADYCFDQGASTEAASTRARLWQGGGKTTPVMVETCFGVGALIRRRARTKVPLSVGASVVPRAA